MSRVVQSRAARRRWIPEGLPPLLPSLHMDERRQSGANALPGQRGAEESLCLASLAVYLFARDN